MDRSEFLSKIGLGASSLLLLTCMGGCGKTGNVPNAPTNVNISIDLTQPAYAALNNPGGYIYINGIIVAQATSGSFLAVSQYCTHQGANVFYQTSTNSFYCPSHGSNFNTNGAVSHGPASTPLRGYNIVHTGNTLTITG